jgi:nucleoside 2-deoxyribosyltransferase
MKGENMKTKIYLAGALFSLAEQDFNLRLKNELENHFSVEVFLPQIECKGLEDNPTKIFEKCKEGIDESNLMIAILDGTDVDSGTAWEIGYAYRSYTSLEDIIGIRTDFRQRGDDFGLNCMISKSLDFLIEEDNMTDIIESLWRIFREAEKVIRW